MLKGFTQQRKLHRTAHLVTRAFDELEEYKKAPDPDADKKWKQQIKDYEQGTGRKFDIKEVEEGEPIRGYIESRKSSNQQIRRSSYYEHKINLLELLPKQVMI